MTVGTDAYRLTGALIGYQAFKSICAAGDTFNYFAEAIDDTNALTGDWEIGNGTYSGLNTIDRNTVTSSSNGNNVVSWKPGSKRIALTISAATLNNMSALVVNLSARVMQLQATVAQISLQGKL